MKQRTLGRMPCVLRGSAGPEGFSGGRISVWLRQPPYRSPGSASQVWWRPEQHDGCRL